MAEMHEEAKAVKPSALKPKAGLELDDDDNVADFLEVQHYHSAASLRPVSLCISCLGVSSCLCKSSPCSPTVCLMYKSTLCCEAMSAQCAMELHVSLHSLC